MGRLQDVDMKIMCYYNKNLKMSNGKIAAQVGHVCRKSGVYSQVTENQEIVNTSDDVIIVLGLRQNKFNEKLQQIKDEMYDVFIQKDLGFTEVEKNTITAFGYIK